MIGFQLKKSTPTTSSTLSVSIVHIVYSSDLYTDRKLFCTKVLEACSTVVVLQVIFWILAQNFRFSATFQAAFLRRTVLLLYLCTFLIHICREWRAQTAKLGHRRTTIMPEIPLVALQKSATARMERKGSSRSDSAGSLMLLSRNQVREWQVSAVFPLFPIRVFRQTSGVHVPCVV